MTRISHITILFALCISACAENQQAIKTEGPRTISVQGASMYERAQVLRAVNEWRSQGENIAIADGPVADFYLSVIDKTPKGRERNYGSTASPFAAIYREGLQGTDFCGAVAHEIGHLTGRSHSTEGIMRDDRGPWIRCGG